MRILFLSDNFPPEVNAPATRTFEHCKEWVSKGVDVTVITCTPNFPEGKVYKGYKNRLIQKETIEGIKVIRVWTFIAANEGFVKRTVDYLSFMLMSFMAGLTVKTDVIVATSPQFFTAISGRWLSFWKRKPWVLEVRDLWPESIMAVGAAKRNIIMRFFEWLERRMYKTATKIVVVTDAFANTIINKHKIAPEKIEVVKNGANLNLFKPQNKNTQLVKSLELEKKCVIGYIGTHGMAHALEFILKCAKKTNDPTLHFLFIGSGAKKNELLRIKDQLHLNNVTMLDSVSKEEVKEYISILDIGLVNLKKSDTFKSVIPSKIFELAAMHKPILLGVEGESAKIVQDHQIGEAFIPENESDFFDKLELIRNRTFDFSSLKENFDRVNLAEKMLNFIKK